MRHCLGCLVLAVMPALGEVGATAIYTQFDTDPSEAVVSSLQSEVDSIMSPAGLRFEWRSLGRVSGSEVFLELAVVKFKGGCDATAPFVPFSETGPLAWSHVTDGEVLPFADVDCNRIATFLKPQLMSYDLKSRERVYGRALGRVLAHELFHIFARSKGHGTRNVDKPYYSAAELVTDSFNAGKEFHMLTARAKNKPTKSKTPESGKSIFQRSGCGSCHGPEGQGTKRAPALRAAGQMIDSVVLAARMDVDGPRMSRQAKSLKLPEPSLAQEDLDELVRFLNGLD